MATPEVQPLVKGHEWVSKPVPLAFLIGEMRLFAVSFPGVWLNANFSELTSDLSDPLPPLERFSPSLDAALVPAHPVEAKIPRLSFTAHSIRYVPAQYLRYYIDVDGPFEEYLKKFSSKSRKNLKREVSKFAELSGGSISWREFIDPTEMRVFYQWARRVSERTYQEQLIHAGLPSTDSFQQEMLHAAARNSVRGYVLFHSDKPIAYHYCLVQQDVIVSDYVGYDPDFRQWRPGTVLLYLMLQKIFTERLFRRFDFGEGEAEYKRFFSTASTAVADLYFFRPTLRNIFLICLHTGLGFLSRATVGLLAWLRLKTHMKRFMRRFFRRLKLGNITNGLLRRVG